MAGSGIRGAFEEKFKALLRDIEDEADNVICFIDEVHMLFQLGKAEGSVDAGQMIKPALARGLRLVGATTRAYLSPPRGNNILIHYDILQRTSTERPLRRMQPSNDAFSPLLSKNQQSNRRSVSCVVSSLVTKYTTESRSPTLLL